MPGTGGKNSRLVNPTINNAEMRIWMLNIPIPPVKDFYRYDAVKKGSWYLDED